MSQNKYLVQHFYEQHGKSLNLKILAGKKGINRRIKKAEVQRPGLSLTGYLKGFVFSRIIVIGKQEIQYLKELEPDVRFERLSAIFTPAMPAVIVSSGYKLPKEMISICEKQDIPLFKASGPATTLVSKISFFLLEEFCPNLTMHGTLVEVFGVGLLIQGESSVGKSEAALGLIERGHRLISDDIVRVKKKEGSYLVGSGPELTRHLMEIRGIGIINVAHLYGAVCVRPDKGIDILIKLEPWNEQYFYDRVGLEEKYMDVLGIRVPQHILPVKPGRDVVLLLETIALNHRLKNMGYNSAKEFSTKLLETIARKQKRGISSEAHM